jgi:3-oxoacyl-[acyl-carrier protein] reductase
MINIKGRTALVTGGSRGIGKAILAKLAKAGADTCFVDLIADSSHAVISEIEALGVQCSFFKADVADFEQCNEITEQVIKRFGKIDILINNAGITRDNLLLKMSQRD